MCIKNYKNMLNNIIDKIYNLKLSNDNTIIIGDNASGKSEILKLLVKLSFEKYYFIDSTNRVFDSTKVNDYNHDSENKYENITKYRLSENIFNLKDSFSIFGDGTGFVESIFLKYIYDLKILIKKFLDVDLDIIEVKNGIFSVEKNITINNEIQNLSNGYQAIIRIFLELIYISKNKNNENITIVIDEIDEYLSSKNKSRIIPFLKEEFPDFKWIFTTHSSEVIASSENFNLIILKENNYECLDSNDFNTVTDVQEIFRNLYNKDIEDRTSYINTTLRRLLSLKISNKWSEQEEKDLGEIESENLTNSQLLLLHQIKNW